MAWSRGSARSSGSKKHARGRFNATILGIVAVLAGAVLFAMSKVTPDRFTALRGVMLDALAPVGSVLVAPVRAVAGWAEDVNAYEGAVERVRALEEENLKLRQQARDAAALEEENRRLKRLVRLVEPSRAVVTAARIVGGSAASPTETAIISAGTRHGVAVGQPVFNDAGLVGRVVETGATAARVLLVGDAASRVPVRVARTGTPALLTGMGGGRAELDLALLADIETAAVVGDRLVTSGEGGIYPPGVPVAEVIEVGASRIAARPLARASALGLVTVERIWVPPLTGTVGGPPPPDQVAAEEAARAAAARAAAEREAAERTATEGADPSGGAARAEPAAARTGNAAALAEATVRAAE